MAAKKRVAVVGAGAAGLAVSRRLRDAGLMVKVLEKSQDVGGVWKYMPWGVMYSSLVTNLPKEIMAFPDFPFDAKLPSFTRHSDVQAYLESYAKAHDLYPLITFGAEVMSVRPILLSQDRETDYTMAPEVDPSSSSTSALPDDDCDWQVTYMGQDSRPVTETFEAVVVANGHFDLPSTPALPYADRFKGRVVHSRDYDSPPKDYEGQVVLCVGYKSSGTDIAREVATVAKEVHVVDRSKSPQGPPEQHGNLFRRPQITRFLDDGCGVEFADGSVVASVDVVLYCTGYDYHLPFLTPSLIRIEERAIHPLFKHIFHAYWPNLSFMGLLHSVVPFPMFDLQAQWITQEIVNGCIDLPRRRERFAWMKEEEERMRQRGQRARDWHYLGPKQWDYQRDLAKATGCLTDRLDRVLSLNQQVYEDVQSQRPQYPGGADDYRRRQYTLDYDNMTWSVSVWGQ